MSPWQSVLLVGALASITEAYVSPSIQNSYFTRPKTVSFQQRVVSGVRLDAKKKKSTANQSNDEDNSAEISNHDINVAATVVEEVTGDAADINCENDGGIVIADDECNVPSEFDTEQMHKAIQLAYTSGGERGSRSPFPKPVAGAIIVAKDGRILGRGTSDFSQDCVSAAIKDTGLEATPLREWCVSWTSNRKLRDDIADSTLYVTLEPSAERHGDSLPPITELIEVSRIPRVVIGSPDPVPERAMVGASALHAAGIIVSMSVEQEECDGLISEYAQLANSKLQRFARSHKKQFGRPLGFLHCSVVDSDNLEAFARHGNAFGKDFGGNFLSYRDFGSYEIAPPPESIWATDVQSDVDYETEVDDFFSMDFEDEEEEETLGRNPMMPWYEQVDAVVVTFPNAYQGPTDDDSITARLFGLKWLAAQGQELPANVERILVMDATDLKDLPMFNEDPNLPLGVDVESFWKAEDRKPTRVLLRRGENAQAQAAAKAAAIAAKAAAKAAQAAVDALESGDAAVAAEAAIECQDAAAASTEYIQKELTSLQELKKKLQDKGVVVETLPHGGGPIDVMNYLGKRNGYESVVWRAGCWGGRGVDAILAGAFQWVSAHLAVDAVGGKFWQLMLAERAVQAACGPERKVKVFSEQEDISLEYCDEEDRDKDCVLTVDGRPVRHVRLDCRVALHDEERPREFQPQKTAKMTKHIIEEEAPWFI
uniref:CMP/dCMP-type deaminase domain-containing protein n=3 Tax=Asterionellopsis glacialis TaxID=33640 RepID=A0A7S0L010_9STRA|mmetsp:Transcript_1388/g.1936  ORF Transcript_1388/g.1936 Transcript_1388/m.1936 type:complete len:711 (+) Transcript_1388:94-2226(+)